MSKKTICVIFAVVAFFAGQIFLEEALKAAGAPVKTFAEFLVPVFELAVGLVLGYFYKKHEDVEAIKAAEVKYVNAENEVKRLEVLLKNSKKVASASSKKKAAKES